MEEILHIPVPPSMQCNAVSVTLRRGFSFSNPVIDNAKKTFVQIRNNSNAAVFLPKNAHIADLRVCAKTNTETYQSCEPKCMKIYDIEEDDLSRFSQPNCITTDRDDYKGPKRGS